MLDFLINSAQLMQIDLSKKQTTQLLQYAELMIKWNKTYNLTAIKTMYEVVKYHILDSLSIVKFVKPTNLLDVGSGAGLPAIVLAIMLEDLQVVAVDSVGKKCHFMQFVKTKLQLTNFKVVNSRIEKVNHKCFQQITSRAFTTIDNNVILSKHLLCREGVFLLMKGENWQDEHSRLSITPYPLKVPFVSSTRFVLKINYDII